MLTYARNTRAGLTAVTAAALFRRLVVYLLVGAGAGLVFAVSVLVAGTAFGLQAQEFWPVAAAVGALAASALVVDWHHGWRLRRPTT